MAYLWGLLSGSNTLEREGSNKSVLDGDIINRAGNEPLAKFHITEKAPRALGPSPG